ncbi:ead/Ea22-like family protein [Acidovorax sp.]|uniref:ead/Ea22-like family protein n=1 Tax=Acidovorax sp. TaxID=1872122 RepID=UPI00391A9E6A
MSKHEELIKKLRRLALAATPGPWSSISRASYWGEEEGDVDGPDGEEIRGAEHVEPLSSQETRRGQAWLRDTDYIACAHPQNILALIDLIESQSREIADMQQQESELCTLYAMAEAECKKLRAEIDAMERQVEILTDALAESRREGDGWRKDAERYRTFIDCGQPICFMGEEYFGKEALDAAIDATKGANHG